MFEFLREDFQHYRGTMSGEPASLIQILGKMLFKPGLQTVLLYRFSRWFLQHRMRPLAFLIYYCNSVLNGAEISPYATIGKAFTIYHPQGVSIGPTVVIGDYCELTHGNTIGRESGEGRPRIGDCFVAGAGSRILGNIKIGNHVRVGANAVVTRSLPNGVTVAGIPAKIIFRAEAIPQNKPPIAPPCSRDGILRRLMPLVIGDGDYDIDLGEYDENTELLGKGIGLDSIEVLRLVAAIEEAFELTIEDDDLSTAQFQTVGSLTSFIQEKLSNGKSDDLRSF